MIRFVAPHLTPDEARKVVANSRAAQKMVDTFSDLKHAHLTEIGAFRLDKPHNIDTDETFDSIEFIVTDRYQKHGATWLAGTHYAVSLDSLIVAYDNLRSRLRAFEDAR